MPTTWNCLAGCVKGYTPGGEGRIRKPLPEASFMPWVQVTVTDGGGKSVSVANKSSKENKACIKSFQFGMSNGNGATIEIVDEEGGRFTNFLNKISTGNAKAATANWVLDVKFGWVTTDCNGTVNFQDTNNQCCAIATGGGRARTSCSHRFLIRNVSVNVANGMFKYSIEATDLTMDVFTTRTGFVGGTDQEGQHLKVAIRNMFQQWNIKVDFMQLDGPCKIVPLEFQNMNDPKSKELGPVGVWRAMYRNPIQAARAWLNSHVSARGRAFVSYWDSSTEGPPTLVFLEANDMNCNQKNSREFNLGTYIVNGGACSPVLSFTPQIQFVMDQVFDKTGGTIGGSLTSQHIKTQGPEPCTAGTTATFEQGWHIHTSETDNDHRLWGKNGKIPHDNQLKTSRANMLSPPITAELRIQGDPSFDRPVLLQGHYVSVVYFNPATITGNGKDGCEWSTMLCNAEISSEEWLIWKVSHEIKEGSFTTTLKLRRTVDGLDRIGK